MYIITMKVLNPFDRITKKQKLKMLKIDVESRNLKKKQKEDKIKKEVSH